MFGSGGGVSSGRVPWNSEGVHSAAQGGNTDAYPAS